MSSEIRVPNVGEVIDMGCGATATVITVFDDGTFSVQWPPAVWNGNKPTMSESLWRLTNYGRGVLEVGLLKYRDWKNMNKGQTL